ncbi:MAG: hypothetical protein M3N53_13535 [Actinomycetota bacterium]|nr:hypothetical protein [Actinomycetota bacterium]
MKKTCLTVALGLALSLVAGAAFAKFEPKFEATLSDTKVNANPALGFHLEFAEDDEEIGDFKAIIPKGFNIAGDAEVPDGEEIGGGTVEIAAGPDCRPGPEGQIPVKVPVTVNATIFERARSDDEADSGVHAVWFLDLEPLNRVRLLVTGSPTTGWTIQGAPTPSDNTCNPLVVDLAINAQSESGVPILTNPKKAGKYKFLAEIASQDSPAVAKFKQVFKITK